MTEQIERPDNPEIIYASKERVFHLDTAASAHLAAFADRRELRIIRALLEEALTIVNDALAIQKRKSLAGSAPDQPDAIFPAPWPLPKDKP